VKSRATRRFWRLYAGLPREVQELAVKNYHLWREDPSHASLHFRALEGRKNLYTVRIGDHYRALGRREDGEFLWLWIGSHAEYDRMVQ